MPRTPITNPSPSSVSSFSRSRSGVNKPATVSMCHKRESRGTQQMRRNSQNTGDNKEILTHGSTGSQRGPHSRSLRVRSRLRPPKECVERPVVDCVFDCGHVFAEHVAVDVMRTGAGHQVLGHVVDGDGVLMGCGVLVTLVGDVNESKGLASMTRYRWSLSVHSASVFPPEQHLQRRRKL